MPVCWLASYPKSGNTWLREILSCMIAPEMNRGDAIPLFQKEYPLDAPTHRLLGADARLLKTHLHPDHARMARCPDTTIGVITIYRHPLDILLSSLNYARVKEKRELFVGETVKTVEDIIADGEFPVYVERFRASDGFDWFSGPSGRITRFQQRWKEVGDRTAYHAIRYETLFEDTEAEVARLAGFLGLELDEEAVRRVVDTADARTAQNGQFFWKRRANNFEEMLPPEAVAHFSEVCRDQLTAFGYC